MPRLSALAKLVDGHPVWMVTPRLASLDEIWSIVVRDIIAATKALFDDYLRAVTPSIH
jgi:hypothetical protein